MNLEKCIHKTNSKIISVCECGKKFYIDNPSQKCVNKVIVDGCLINDSTTRCDYLFEIFDIGCKRIESVFYLELKGCDVKKAFEQLEATIDCLKPRHSSVTKRYGYIVASRVPKSGPKIQVLTKKMAAKCGVILRVSTTQKRISI